MQDVIKKLMLVVLAFSLTFTTDTYAQEKKPTSKKSTSAELKKKKPKKVVQSSKKKKSRKVSRYRYKRNPNAPDIKKLTTEDPDAKYIQAPNNGVNNIEL